MHQREQKAPNQAKKQNSKSKTKTMKTYISKNPRQHIVQENKKETN